MTKANGDTLDASEWNAQDGRITALEGDVGGEDFFRWNGIDTSQFDPLINSGFVNPAFSAVNFGGLSVLSFSADSAAVDAWCFIPITGLLPLGSWAARLFSTWPTFDPSGEIGSGFAWAGDAANKVALVNGAGINAGGYFNRMFKINGDGLLVDIIEDVTTPVGAGYIEARTVGTKNAGVSPSYVSKVEIVDLSANRLEYVTVDGYPPGTWPSPWPTSDMDRVGLAFFSKAGASVSVSSIVSDFVIRKA